MWTAAALLTTAAILFAMGVQGIPIGRIARSSNEDIIAGVDFLSVFMRNAEERYYPDYSKTKSPFDVEYDTSSKRPRFSISTKPTTTEPTTVTTTTRKPKLSIPTLPTIRKVETTTTEAPNLELRTAAPPITNSDVYKYIKSKSSKEKSDEVFRKEDTFTEISVEVGTEKSKPNPNNAVSLIEPSAIVSNSNTDQLTIEEEDPLTIEATEINEEITPEKPEQKRVNRMDDSTYHYDYNRNNRPNKARSISYSTVIQSPGQEVKTWKPDQTQEYISPDYDLQPYKDRKNHSESVAETKDYYVTSKFNPDEYNDSLDKKGENWEQKKYEEQQFKIHHTTEKIWGVQQTTPKVWGSTEKPWGVQQTTPKVWGVQQTTPKVWGSTEKNWGVQQTTPKVWGVQQTTPKVWGVQQTTPKVWGVQQQPYTEKPWVEKQYNRIYAQPEQNYEVDETVSLLSNGRTHGVQGSDLEKPLQIKVGAPTKPNDNQKVGYVVEGRNYKKYRVEERTSDGFIVGEYGVVSNNDGSLRGVRYTADGTINPSVIYDALMKFLSL